MASKNKTQQLLQELQSGEVRVRKDAALKLGRSGRTEAVAPLLKLLKDSSWKVRRNATIALGKIGAAEAASGLIGVLSDRTLAVRRAAVRALGSLGNAQATDRLLLLLEEQELADDVIESLFEIGIPAFLRCCELVREESAHVESLVGTVNPHSRHLPITSAPPSIQRMLAPNLHSVFRLFILDPEKPHLASVLRAEHWSGQQRNTALEQICALETTLNFVERWKAGKAHLIGDVQTWCERVCRESPDVALRQGAKEVLDYRMLGRASQRDFAAEGSELLRAAQGTSHRDTGETLLRASDAGAVTASAPALLTRLRRWLKQRE